MRNENPDGEMNKPGLHKILVANRGEIAVRVISAIRQSGLQSVAIYPGSDKDMPYVHLADEAWPLGNGAIQDTFLNQQLIIDIARKSNASAIHPGYGFLAENGDFARLCRKNDLVFIGPSPEVIDLMGNKANAREMTKKIGIPVLEGRKGTVQELTGMANELPYPLLIKPAAGGGGKGMKIVGSSAELAEALLDATRESLNYFGSGELYVERYIQKARHIEVQMLGDHHGNMVHLFDRECTLQRRHQKIIEEAPATSLSLNTRKKIFESALKLASEIGYTNAGTIEFLVDENEAFYFMEMNTRIQVENPVTELITGLDIVKEQLQIAGGAILSVRQNDIRINGHAMEARVYAEDPRKEFMPASGTIRNKTSVGTHVRIDEGYVQGNTVSPLYDPLVAKLISHGTDRNEAIRKLILGIKNYHLSGITTNRDFLVTLLQSEDFEDNSISTKYIDQHLPSIIQRMENAKNRPSLALTLSIMAVAALNHRYKNRLASSIWNEIGQWRQMSDIQIQFNDKTYRIPFRIIKSAKMIKLQAEGKMISVEILDYKDSCYKLQINGQQYDCWADLDGPEIVIDIEHFTFFAKRLDIPDDRYLENSVKTHAKAGSNEINAPLNGKVVKIAVQEADPVSFGDTLLIIESMKMENRIASPKDAEIDKIKVSVGELVELNKLLIILK
ncbi:MAG: biotin carboxylase N-terminal domain-containing protein [Bacteroidales bacterium]